MSRRRIENDKKELYTAISIVLSYYTYHIFVGYFRILAVIGLICLIIGLFYLVKIMIELKKRRGRRSKKKHIVIARILYVMLSIGILIFGCLKIDIIHEKFRERSGRISEVTEVSVTEKGKLGLVPRREGILLKVLNNMTTTTGQVQ